MRVQINVLCMVIMSMLTNLSVSRADTYIPAGPVSGVWDATGNDYIVQGDIWVGDGDWLRIEPGVIVLFEADCGLTDSGQLTASGNEADPVYLEAYISGSEWDGIGFQAADEGCVLNHCHFKEAGAAGNGSVYISNSGTNVVIKDCNIRSSQSDGMVIDSSAPTVTGCDISYNYYGNGLRIINGSTPLIEKCTIHDNEYHGVAITNSAPEIRHCQVTANIVNGIVVDNASLVDTPKVRYCTIQFNRENGVLINNGVIDLGTEFDPGYNDLYFNYVYEVNNQTVNYIPALYNCWYYTEPADIEGVIWDDSDNSNLGMVDFWPCLPRLWSDTYLATAYNNGRHLVHRNSDLWVAFQRKGSIRYAFGYENGTIDWAIPERFPDVDYAYSPCIAPTFAYGYSATCVAYQAVVNGIWEGIRSGLIFEGWRIKDIITPQEHPSGPWITSSPSMVDEANDTCHLVVETSCTGLYEMKWNLYYFKYLDSLPPEYLLQVACLDSMVLPIGPTASQSPSIAVDVNGRCHVAYSRVQNPIDPTSIEIYYIEETATGWSDTMNISQTPTASIQPSISCWGPMVYVVWSEEQADGTKDIYRKERDINISPPQWSAIRNVCEVAGLPPNQESEYPVISGSFTIWAENYSGTNWEAVYYNPDPLIGFGNISNTVETSSVFPHSDIRSDAAGTHLYSIWTEVIRESEPQVCAVNSRVFTFARRLPYLCGRHRSGTTKPVYDLPRWLHYLPIRHFN